MDLAHTVCVCDALAIRGAHAPMPQQTPPFKFQNKPLETLLWDSLHGCVPYAFLENEWVVCEFYHFVKIFDMGLVVFNIEGFEISVIVMITMGNRN